MDMTFWSPNSILRLKLDSQYWYFIVVFSFHDVAYKAVVHTGLMFFLKQDSLVQLELVES